MLVTLALGGWPGASASPRRRKRAMARACTADHGSAPPEFEGDAADADADASAACGSCGAALLLAVRVSRLVATKCCPSTATGAAARATAVASSSSTACCKCMLQLGLQVAFARTRSLFVRLATRGHAPAVQQQLQRRHVHLLVVCSPPSRREAPWVTGIFCALAPLLSQGQPQLSGMCVGRVGVRLRLPEGGRRGHRDAALRYVVATMLMWRRRGGLGTH